MNSFGFDQSEYKKHSVLAIPAMLASVVILMLAVEILMAEDVHASSYITKSGFPKRNM